MKTTYSILIMALLVLSAVAPLVLATDTNAPVPVTIITEKFKPVVWMCDSRTVQDDNLENGINGLNLSERKHNYAFSGESIHWTVLVMDKNKIEAITSVDGTAGSSQGAGNDAVVQCVRTDGPRGDDIARSCNARLGEEVFHDFNEDTMAYYDCRLTITDAMHGESFLTVEAKTADDSATMTENEFWFLNPEVALKVDGALTFNDVRPGSDAYSDTLLVGNDAESGSGVILDMFISGTDFLSTSPGANCKDPVSGDRTNKLSLGAFRYYVTNGAYSSFGKSETDSEGYTNIPYGNEISAAKRVMRWNTTPRGAAPSSSVTEADWNNGNALSPGSEMALNFKLSMPEPCDGDFSDGSIYFWGEAI